MNKNITNWALVFTLLGLISGGLTIGGFYVFATGLFLFPGIMFGLLSVFAMSKSGITEVYKMVIIVIASLVGYFAAVILAMNNETHMSYLIYMAISGLVGAAILGAAYWWAKLAPSFVYVLGLILFSVVASIVTPKEGGYVSGPDIFFLFPIWHGLVGAYLGFLVMKNRAKNPPVSQIKSNPIGL